MQLGFWLERGCDAGCPLISLTETKRARAARRRLILLGALGVLPALVLGGFGLFSLRREEVVALHEVGEAAQALAPQLASAIHRTLFSPPLPSRADVEAFDRTPGSVDQEPTLRIGSESLAVFVGEGLTYPSLEAKPERAIAFDPTILPPDLGELWTQLSTTVSRVGETVPASRAWSALLDRVAGTPVERMVRFRWGQSLIAEGRTTAARPVLEEVLESSGTVAGETGLPLDVLAWRSLLRVAEVDPQARPLRGPWMDAYCHRVLIHWRLPKSLLQEWETSDRLQLRPWIELADRHDAMRRVLIPLLRPFPESVDLEGHSDFQVPRWLSTNTVEDAQLLSRHEVTGGAWFLVRSGRRVDEVLRENARHLTLPRQVAASVTIAGWERGVVSPNDVSSETGELLATASIPGVPTSIFSLNLRMDRRDLFLEPVRWRARLFGVLIALASVTSAVAVLVALRSWNRQRLLAEMQAGFVASVSHELRAPLASVRLLAEELVDLGEDAPSRRDTYLRLIVRETRRLGFLIENVLRHARLERGSGALELSEVDLREVVRQSEESVRPAAEEREVQVQTVLPDEPVFAAVDASGLQQVLVNLLDNALKHSPSGSAIRVGLVRDEDGSARLWVEDHGAGIPREDQPRLFEAFYRRGTELRRETPGVGLGLTIVHRIVAAHGGRVTVESRPGAGARFEVRLPRSSNPSPT
jgi:signal transduction histidine kinase